jgi:pyruvate dehydrogenase E2 component (dihydrolipoamide acetyltransferase)
MKWKSENNLLKRGKMTQKNKSDEKPAGKIIPVLMPQAGQTMEDGTVISWKIKEGDRIEVGQIIFEIETDKANIEVEAVDSGRVAKIIAKEGQTVKVKTPVAYIADEDVDVEAYLVAESSQSKTNLQTNEPANETQQMQQTEKAVDKSGDSGRKISPAARKLAEQKGMDISVLSSGSGPGGRIITKDIEKVEASTSGRKGQPINKMRRAIAQNLTYSKQNIPHFYIKLTIEAQKLFDVYQQTKQGIKCTINDFIILACAKAIRQHPAFRSQYKNDEIKISSNVNIGIAVGLDDGLVVPVIVDADKMNFKSLAERSRQIIENARNGKLEGIGQGIFTITNLGMFGVEEFNAIINPPESAILAVGTIREGIKVENGLIKPTRLMTLSLSLDHRVVDGVSAAKFLQTLKELLEEPEQLVN